MIEYVLKGSRDGQRACIVIFEEEKTLLAAHKMIKDHPTSMIKNNIGILTEAANIPKINQEVNRATTKNRVTFLTRNYGRGTDFIVLDKGVLSNGGLCTICTFLPESESELI